MRVLINDKIHVSKSHNFLSEGTHFAAIRLEKGGLEN